MQILGRGTFFDDVCQMSLMGESTVHRVFHTFYKKFAQELYHNYVQLPKGDDKRRVMEYYNKLRLTGAIGSTDVTHVKWDACPASLERSYSGKEGHPTIAYEATVDFSGRLLGTTRGFPGANNDKTIIRYDLTVSKIREDREYTEQTFELKNKRGETVVHKGNFLLVDNGYHKVCRWFERCTIGRCHRGRAVDRGASPAHTVILLKRKTCNTAMM